MVNKVMPNNLEAEESVLGACFLSKYALQKATENLLPESFYNEKNANSLDLFLSHLVQLDALREKRIALMKKISNNLDGTVGSQIYNMTKSKFMEGK